MPAAGAPSGRPSLGRVLLGVLATAGCCVLGTVAARAEEPLAPTSLVPPPGAAAVPTGPLAPTPLAPIALLPPTAPDIRLGELRAQVEGALGEVPARVPGWVIEPSIAVDGLATDNVLETEHGRRADLLTMISPAIVVHGDTPRLQLDLAYTPTIVLDAFTAHQNTLLHNGNGEALVTLVPNALFLDLRGFATAQATSGGFSPTGPTPLNQSNLTTFASGSVSPYYVHRFDDVGALRLGYIFNKTVTDSGTPFFSPTPGPAAFPISTNFNLTSNEEYGTFRTGENFGRYNNQISADAVQESGFGLVANAHRNVLLDQPAYAIDPRLTAYAQIGYEDIAYPNALPRVRIEDAIWAVGFRLTPKPDSIIDVRYGHRDGINSATVNASYALTARTKIFARYSEGLASQAEEIASALNSSGVGFGNNSVDVVTGAPVLLSNQQIAVQPNLFHVKLFSITTVTAWPRDTLSLSLLHEEDDLVAISPGSFGFSDRGSSASVSWGHQLSERLGGSATVSYNIFDVSGPASGSQHFFTLAVTASYNFTRTLTGVAQYAFLGRTASLPGQAFIENQALIGFRKTF
jgi:uncharacterized protein (PEP-CTERM system associated)